MIATINLLSTLDTLIAEERFEAARKALLDEDWDRDETTRARLALREAELDANEGLEDEAILRLGTLPADLLPGEEAARAAALIATCFGRKRCRELAAQALAEAEARHSGAWQVALAAGTVALNLDDREAAARYCAEARARGGGVRATLAEASVAFVAGDFLRVHAILAGIAGTTRITTGSEAAPPGEGDRDRAAMARLRAAVASAEGDHAAEAAAWREVLAALPESDHKVTAWLNLGFALAAAGDRAAARAELEACWRAFPEHPTGVYANSRATLLARAPADAPRRALPFPSTQQKYAFCGPAVLELCLRALGIELTQDEIAADVRREHGTPMYEIVRFLGERQIAARRVVATAGKVRAAIDLGLPLIIQEEHSTTSHVAVIMGYDAALEVFLVRDPMTHQLSTRPWGWTESAGWLYGSGAVLVAGRLSSPETAGVLAACDAAGLVDAEHLALCDDISRRRSYRGDREGRGDMGAAIPLETLELTRRALALDDGFGLAWVHRFWAYAALAGSDPGRWSEDTLDCLVEIRERFPYSDWPWQAHGRWLLDQGQYAESFAAYLSAHRIDPDDGNNLAWMGYCRQRERRLAAAERHLLAALRAAGDPGLREGILAEMYLYAVEAVEAVEDDGEDGPITISPPSGEPVERIARDRDDLIRRGRHFAAVATELVPHQRSYWELRGLLAIRDQDPEAARAAFTRARDGEPDRYFAVLGLAHVHAADGDREGALALFADACRFAPGTAEPWLRRAALLAGHSDHTGAAAVLEEGLVVAGSRERFVTPLWNALTRLGSDEEAAARLRERVSGHDDRGGDHGRDSGLLLAAAGRLDSEGQRGHAIALLRAVLAANPGNLTATAHLGRMLCESALTRAEGRGLLAAAVQAAPRWVYPRECLAMAWAEEDPRQGLEILAPVLGEDDLYANEAHALLLEAAGETEKAERINRRIIAAHDGSETEALLRMCRWNWAANRYERALSWARRLRALPLAGDTDPENVLYTWLTAHRLAGRFGEVLEDLRARFAENVPKPLAREVYYGAENYDHALAARAAQVMAEAADAAGNLGDRLEWRIARAKMLGLLGDTGAVRALWSEAEALGTAEGWANLSWGFTRLKQYADADRAAAAALTAGPDDAYALTAALEAALRAGGPAGALALAHRLYERHPYDHRGPERLAELYAKTLDPENAISHGELAIEAAPYCHNAHAYGALAFLIGGERDRARRHAEQALRLSPPDDPDGYDAGLLVTRTLSGDLPGLERCLAASPEPEAVLAPFFTRLREMAADESHRSDGV